MSTAREDIFRRIHGALDPIPAAKKTAYPDWDTSLALSRHVPENDSLDALVAQFSQRLVSTNAHLLDGWSALAAFLAEHQAEVGYVDPVLAEDVQAACPRLTLKTDYQREDVDIYHVGITRAVGGIAETGTIVLKDRETSARLGFFAPWVHVAVLEKTALVPDVPTALTTLGDDPYVTFITGPSKTADIEGVLIEGVHGPGIQACLLI